MGPDLNAWSDIEEIDVPWTKIIVRNEVYLKEIVGMIEISSPNISKEHDVNPPLENCESTTAYFTSIQ